ncbi:MlaD family protein [Conexibacter sp. SYSU D00693]|uniref:MlaD family protein n=1 Tax=Conexibacter sp. SYSU D00693 TaxID=2812560 RepID=UPI00196B0CBC|nr:MlaD family protein [Conexibacter sp. SYSU D00693]
MTGRLAAGVALVVAVVVAVLVARGDGDVQRVDAVFDAAPGLVRGAEVRAGGKPVGSVEEIRLERGRPRVTLALDRGFRVRRGTVADLRLQSLSGESNRYVDLHGGDGPALEDGAVLGRAQTDQPVEVEDVLATLDPATRRNAGRLLDGLRRATAERGADGAIALRRAGTALQQVGLAAGDVAADGAALRRLVRSSATVAAALERDPGATGAAIDDLAAVLGDAAAQQEDVAAAVQALPAGLRAPRQALARLRRDAPTLTALARELQPGARQLPSTAGELRTALDEGAPALRDVRRVTGTAPGALRALRPLLREAEPVARRADRVLDAGGPILAETRVRLPDAFSFFANWADFTSNYDANGHGARVSLIFPPAALNEIGPSDTGAGQLEAPFIRTPGVLEGEPWESWRTTLAPQAEATP